MLKNLTKSQSLLCEAGAGRVHVHKTYMYKYCLAYRQGTIGIGTTESESMGCYMKSETRKVAHCAEGTNNLSPNKNQATVWGN